METFAERIAREGPITELDAVGWAIRLAKRLEQLHALGVAHGSVSPACFLVGGTSRDAKAVLVDVSHAPSDEAFFSPERTQNGMASVPDDAWALAATLYAALTGVDPFRGSTSDDTRRKIRAGAPAPLAAFDVGDDDLQRVLDDAFHRDPAKRKRTLRDLRLALEEWHPDESVRHLPPIDDAPGESIRPAPVAAVDEDDDENERTVMRDMGALVAAQRAPVGAPPPPASAPRAPEPRPAAPAAPARPGLGGPPPRPGAAPGSPLGRAPAPAAARLPAPAPARPAPPPARPAPEPARELHDDGDDDDQDNAATMLMQALKPSDLAKARAAGPGPAAGRPAAEPRPSGAGKAPAVPAIAAVIESEESAVTRVAKYDDEIGDDDDDDDNARTMLRAMPDELDPEPPRRLGGPGLRDPSPLAGVMGAAGAMADSARRLGGPPPAAGRPAELAAPEPPPARPEPEPASTAGGAGVAAFAFGRGANASGGFPASSAGASGGFPASPQGPQGFAAPVQGFAAPVQGLAQAPQPGAPGAALAPAAQPFVVNQAAPARGGKGLVIVVALLALVLAAGGTFLVLWMRQRAG